MAQVKPRKFKERKDIKVTVKHVQVPSVTPPLHVFSAADMEKLKSSRGRDTGARR